MKNVMLIVTGLVMVIGGNIMICKEYDKQINGIKNSTKRMKETKIVNK